MWRRSKQRCQATLTSKGRARFIRPLPLALEELESRTVPSVTLLAGSNPTQTTSSFIDPNGTSVFIPLRATDSTGSAVTFSVSNPNPQITITQVPASESLRLTVSGKDKNGNPFSGDLVLRLFPGMAPDTAARISQLVTQGFYNTTSSQTMTFHRIIPGFVAQGGDPTGTGTGGSGVKIISEFTNASTFTSAGLLAMANSGPDTNDSQFFITDPSIPFSQYPQSLNFQYTIFGQLVSGFDIFSDLINTPTDPTTNKPLTPVIIQNAQLFTDTQDAVLQVTVPTGVLGSDTVTVTATGGGGATASQSFAIQASPNTSDGTSTGTPINERPYLNFVNNQTTTAGTPLTFNLNGTDIDGDQLTYVVKDPATFGTPANVTVALNGNQATLTPNAGFIGNITLIAGVRDQTVHTSGDTLDSQGEFSTHEFTLTVTPTTATPGIVLDSASDTGLFNNDNYTDATTPTFDIATDPGKTVQVSVNGTVVMNATETSTPGTYKATLPAGSLAVGPNTILAQVQGGTALPSITVTYAPSDAEAYVVPGQGTTAEALTFKYVAKLTDYMDEVGFFQVDDTTGKIGTLSPGDPGYAQAAISSATKQVLFTPSQTTGATDTISLTPGKLLGFYLIQHDTSANFLANNPTDSTTGNGPLAFFSLPAANPDSFDHLHSTADSVLGAVQYRWEDMTGGGDKDFNDAVFSVAGPNEGGATPGEALRVPAGASQNVQIQATLQTAFKALTGSSGTGASTSTAGGEVGIFKVDGPDGNIGGVKPGQSGYVQAALGSGHQVLFNQGDSAGKQASVTLPGSQLFGFYYIPNGTAAQVLASNPNNSATGTPVVFFSFAAANPDSAAAHFSLASPERILDTAATETSIVVHAMGQLSGGLTGFDDLAFAVNMTAAS
jgi:cyclophilin family peptidyl-prolyl cis-trans isomerase